MGWDGCQFNFFKLVFYKHKTPWRTDSEFDDLDEYIIKSYQENCRVYLDEYPDYDNFYIKRFTERK